jgi:uncharacterized MAPEG superfamily protein
MPMELFWLTLTAAMTGLFWVLYVLNRMAVRGLWPTLDNPKPGAPPLSNWAERQMRAHTNAVENLVVFAPLVLTAHALGVSNEWTVGACAVYFWARLAHYLIYTAGIPVLRTLSFAAGFAAQVVLVLAIFKLV